MTPLDDRALLQDFARTRSEPAFAELARRHVDLVYSAAMRRLNGDPHRAREASQEVFVALARNASSLARHPALRAWLFVATRHAASNLLRAERRRDRRHWEAHVMNETNAPVAESADWSRLAPVLDTSLDELSEKDRRVVLLRFFDQRSFPEIGAALALSEDAARKQVERALAKLRKILERRGVTSTESALSAAIAAHAVAPAPAGLGASLATGALAAAGTGATWLASWATAAKVVAGAAVVATAIVVAAHRPPPAAAALPVSAPPSPPPTPAPMPPPAIPAVMPAQPTPDTDLAEALSFDEPKTGRREAAKAAAAYARAAEKGSAAAEYRLGYLSETGDGVPQDYGAARTHYARAVELGFTRGNLRLGLLDLEGWGAARDMTRAVERITMAAKAGDPAAQQVLSGMYFAGVGVKPDLRESLAWEAEVAKTEDPVAAMRAGAIAGVLERQDVALQRNWYELSAEQNYTHGLFAMATTFLKPGAPPEQFEQGKRWLDLAAERGDAASAFILGGLYLDHPQYRDQSGAEKTARRFFEQAKARGDRLAEETLEWANTKSLRDAFHYVLNTSSEEKYIQRNALQAGQRQPDAHGYLPPLIKKMVSPVYPIALRLDGTKGQALVEFTVDVTGRTKNIKLVKASHPGFGEPATLAVAGWRFEPAMKNGHAVEQRVQVPVVFDLRGEAISTLLYQCEPGQIRREVFAGGYVGARNGGTPAPPPPASIGIGLTLKATRASDVRGWRVVVKTAVDDQNAPVNATGYPEHFYSTAVGMTSAAELARPSLSSPSVHVAGIAVGHAIGVVSGRVEIFAPESDPRSVVTVPDVATHFGRPLENQTLADEGIVVVLYDQTAAEKFRGAPAGSGGPQDYDVMQSPESPYKLMPAEMRPRSHGSEISPTAIALGISDPRGHLVAVEFRDRDGQPLRYNHNGSSHSSGMPGKPERRYDVYDLERKLPEGAQLVCWVATSGTIHEAPFEFKNLRVPGESP